MGEHKPGGSECVCKRGGDDGELKEMLPSFPISPEVGRLGSFHSRDLRATDYKGQWSIKEYEDRVFCKDADNIGKFV